MSRTSLIYNRSHRLVYLFLLLFLFFVPVKLDYSNLFFLLAIVTFFVAYPFMFRSYEMSQHKKWGVLLSSEFVLYLFIILSCFFSEYVSDALKSMEHRASFLFIPLLFFLGFKLSGRELERILSGFVIGTFLKVVYLYFLTIYALVSGSLSVGDLNFERILSLDLFSYNHPTYLSFYALFSLVIIFASKKMRYYGWFKVITTLLFTIMIFFLESRVMIGLTLLLLLISPVLLSKTSRGLLTGFGLGFGLIVLIGIVGAISGKYDSVNERFSDIRYDITNNNKLKNDPKSYDSRMSRWIVAADLIKERPFNGYGAGAEIKVLMPAYESQGLEWSYDHKLNIHNQYLSLSLESGILAGLFYIYMLIYLFVSSLRKHNLIGILFALICATMSMFENVLNTNSICTIFGFMSIAFLFQNRRNNESHYDV